MDIQSYTVNGFLDSFRKPDNQKGLLRSNLKKFVSKNTTFLLLIKIFHNVCKRKEFIFYGLYQWNQ